MSPARRLFGFTRAIEARHPPAGRMIGGVHAVEAGRPGGPPVVLLHGASGNVLDWTSSILPRAGRRVHVVALDRPGFGHSRPVPGAWRLDRQAAVLRRALHNMGHRRYLLIGHSYGAALALAWTLAHPAEVAGVLSLAGATMDWGGGGIGAHYHLGGRAVIGDVLARAVPVLAGPRTVEAAARAVFVPNPMPPDYVAAGGVMLALRPRTFRENATMMLRFYPQVRDQVPRYGEIACPVEIVHGAADEIVPPAIHGPPLAEALTGTAARLTLLPGIGHMPHHAAPAAVLDAIDRLAARA